MTGKEISVEYSVKDLLEQLHIKVDNQALKLDSINTQVQLTNGRVTKSEDHILEIKKRSIGIWIRQHPYKFGVLLTIVTLTLISDFRHPIIEGLGSLVKIFI